MGRMFSPLSRSALAVASVEAQAKRRKQRVQRWREHFKRVRLSRAWQESAIVQSAVGMIRMSADVTRMLRPSSSSQYLGAGYRRLRMESLEGRQMLSATTIDLAAASDSVSPNTILPGTDTDDVTNISTPVFQGTADPDTTIEVFDGTNPTPIATATANETGDWVTSPLAVALIDDVHSITAKASDGLGNISTSGTLFVTIDTIVVTNTTPVMTAATDSGSSSSDNITNDNTPTFAGMTEDDAPNNAYVELLLDGTTVIATGNASSGVWTLTPMSATSDGTYTVQARVTDHTGNVSTSAPATIVIDTISPNAVDDAASTNEDTPVTIDVVANDTDTVDPSLTVTGVINGSNGTVVNNDNGTVSYTPNLNFNGTDAFTYTVTDDAGNSATATVTITVTGVNDAPTAVNDTASTDEDTPVTTDNVLTNDTDVDNTLVPASITAFSQGTNGTVISNNDGTFTYTPILNFNGTDTFTYTITDDGGLTATATVTITVTTVNDAPVALNDTVSTDEDTPVKTDNVLTNDTDVDDTLVPASITAFSQGTNGTVVSNNDGTFTYTPNANFNGTDSFNYTISDGTVSATAMVTITVTAVNDAPVALNDTASTNEDTPVTTDNVLTNDTDVDNTLVPASITAFTQGTNGSVVSNNDGTFTYTPILNFNGTDSFTYTISDGTASATATVTITVTGVNDAPAAVNDTASTDEDTPVTVSVLANDNGGPVNEVQTVTVTATTDGANGTVTTNGTTITYMPSLNFHGTDTFTYTISDDGGLTATAIVTVTVGSVNDAPAVTVNSGTVTVNEGSPAGNSGSFVDVDSANVTITASVGTITQTSGANGAYTWSFDTTDGPDESQTVTITATDSDGGVSTLMFSLVVNNVIPSVAVTGTSSANDGQTLTYTFTTTDPGADRPFTRAITSSNPLDVVTPVSFDPTTGSGSFKVKFHGPVGPSTSTLTVNVNEQGGSPTGSGTLAVIVNNTFRVTGIVVNDSGFDVTFNNAIDFTNLNLYDGINPLLPGDTFKLPDVVVHAAIANVDMKGSVVWTAATNTLSWVKSGNVLGADTYFLKLVSGLNAFKDISGNLLDGNGDFLAGDNYQQSVPISVLGGTPIVSLPDFARGPRQDVDLTANNTLDTTLPVRATGVNVQGVDFKLVYDTALLTINPDQVTAVLPNWTVATNQSLVGTIATLIVSASANLPSAAFTGTSAFVNIIATVPGTAPYGATQVLRLVDSAINEISAKNDYAIQKVAFPGDANGSGILPSSSPPIAYTAEDAALIARVVVGATGTTGFDAYPLVDPAIVGDASGNGGASLSAFDTSLIAQESAGINTPEVPDGTAAGSGGSALYDPLLSIPDNIPVVPGHTYELPVNIAIEPMVVGIISSTYTVKYHIDDLDFLGASNGSDFSAPGWTMTASEQVPGTIRVSIFSTFPSGNNAGVPLQLGKLNFLVLAAANLGVSPLQIDPVDPHESGLVWTKDDGSVRISNLQGDFNFDNSVDASDYVVWRKQISTVGTGSAVVNETDYTIWRSNFGATFPGAGTGAAIVASTSDSTPVSPSNSTEVLPAAARDKVLEGFALVSRSATSRTTRTVRKRSQEKSQLSDGNLLYAVTHEKRYYAADKCDSLREDNSINQTDAVDELLSDLDCELIKMI
jgi:hypothetical protein